MNKVLNSSKYITTKMSLSLYTEGIFTKTADPVTLNGLTLHPDTLKLFSHNTLPIAEQTSVSARPKLGGNVNMNTSDRWILSDKGVYKCCGVTSSNSYSSNSIYFSLQYHDLMCRSKIFKESYNKLLVSTITPDDLNSKFYTITHGEIEYVVDNIIERKRYINHEILESLIREYLVKNSTVLLHDQLFLVNYINPNVSKREFLVGVRLRLKPCGKITQREYVEIMSCSGVRFNTEYSSGITFSPSKETLEAAVFTSCEKINYVSVNWNYTVVVDKQTCNFVDDATLKGLVFSRIDSYAIKLGAKGRVKTQNGVVSFCVTKINNDSLEKNSKKETIYHTSDEPVDYIYLESSSNDLLTYDTKATVNVPIEKLLTTGYLTINKEDIILHNTMIQGPNTEFPSGDVLERFHSVCAKFELFYEASTNSNVAFVDLSQPTVRADTITIDVTCRSSINDDFLLWRSHHTDAVRELLSNQKTIGLASLQKVIDGNLFDIKIMNYEPRTNYSSGKLYCAINSIHYDDKHTKLIINVAKSEGDKPGSTKIDVVVTDNNKNDSVTSMDCIVVRVDKSDKKMDTASVLQLYSTENYAKTNDHRDVLMLDETRLLQDVLKSKTVWEGRKISLIVPQHNMSIVLTFKNISWKDKKKGSHYKTLDDDSVVNENKIHVGDMSLGTKIRWCCPPEMYIVPKTTNYRELTYKDIEDWSKQNKIGGLNSTLWDLYKHLIVLRNPKTVDVLKRNGLKPSKGVILYGPPGNGKTKVARCLGRLLGSRDEHIILCSATELLSKWLGESEKNIAKLFEPAERAFLMFGQRAPLYTVIIDEIDIVAQQRGSYNDSTGVRDGMVNQLLTKIDGLIEKDNIILIGLTNRESILDRALLREGRLDRMVYVGCPDFEGRKEILDLYVRPWIKNPSKTVNVESEGQTLSDLINELAVQTDNFSGADLQGFVSYVVKEYWSSFLEKQNKHGNKQYIPSDTFLTMLHAYKKIKNSS